MEFLTLKNDLHALEYDIDAGEQQFVWTYASLNSNGFESTFKINTKNVGLPR